MTTIEDIQRVLIEALKQSGMKQDELAKKVGVSQSMISHYISGRKMPALDTFANLCAILDVDTNDILCVDEERAR